MNFGDEELMVMFAAGVTAAFDMLYERYRHRIYRFALNCLRNQPDAEDVVQEVFIRLIRHAPRYQPMGRFQSWIFQIAVNRIRTHIGRRGLADDSLKPSDESNMPASLIDVRHPERRLMAGELIEMACQRLSSNQRMILLLKEVEGMDSERIGQTLNLTAENVRIQLHRARRQMIQFLSEKGVSLT